MVRLLAGSQRGTSAAASAEVQWRAASGCLRGIQSALPGWPHPAGIMLGPRPAPLLRSGTGACLTSSAGSASADRSAVRDRRKDPRQASGRASHRASVPDEAVARVSAPVVRDNVVETVTQVGHNRCDSLCPYALGCIDAL